MKTLFRTLPLSIALTATAALLGGAVLAQTTTSQPAAVKSTGPHIASKHLIGGAEKRPSTIVYLSGPTTINNRVDKNAELNLQPTQAAPQTAK